MNINSTLLYTIIHYYPYNISLYFGFLLILAKDIIIRITRIRSTIARAYPTCGRLTALAFI